MFKQGTARSTLELGDTASASATVLNEYASNNQAMLRSEDDMLHGSLARKGGELTFEALSLETKRKTLLVCILTHLVQEQEKQQIDDSAKIALLSNNISDLQKDLKKNEELVVDSNFQITNWKAIYEQQAVILGKKDEELSRTLEDLDELRRGQTQSECAMVLLKKKHNEQVVGHEKAIADLRRDNEKLRFALSQEESRAEKAEESIRELRSQQTSHEARSTQQEQLINELKNKRIEEVRGLTDIQKKLQLALSREERRHAQDAKALVKRAEEAEELFRNFKMQHGYNEPVHKASSTQQEQVIKDLKGDIRKLQDDLRERVNSHSRLETSHKPIPTDADQTKRDIESKLDLVQRDLVSKRKATDTLQADLEAKRQKITEMEQQHQETIDELTYEMKNMEVKHTSEIKKLDEELQDQQALNNGQDEVIWVLIKELDHQIVYWVSRSERAERLCLQLCRLI